MKMTKDKYALIYRIILVVVTFIALYLNFKFLTFKVGIVYFTYLSNVSCLIYYLFLVIRTMLHKYEEDKYHYIIKGMVIMALTLTMVIYNFVLAKDNPIYINHELECNLVHLVVPLLAISDYIIFGKKGYLKKEYPFIWLISLVIYQIFIMVYSTFGGKFINNAEFPYVYMDTAIFGNFGVLLNYVLIIVIYILYGQLIVSIDNYLGERVKIK